MEKSVEGRRKRNSADDAPLTAAELRTARPVRRARKVPLREGNARSVEPFPLGIWVPDRPPPRHPARAQGSALPIRNRAPATRRSSDAFVGRSGPGWRREGRRWRR